jgi:hypothetical protein
MSVDKITRTVTVPVMDPTLSALPGKPPRRRGGVAGVASLILLAGCASGGPHPPTPDRTPVSASTSTAEAAPPAPRAEKWIDLQMGDCLGDPPPTDPGVVTVSVVDCATAHAAEVFLRTDLEVNAAVSDVADQKCGAAFTRYTGQPAHGGPLAVTYLIDSNQDRTSADPLPSTLICLLQSSGGLSLTGSARR